MKKPAAWEAAFVMPPKASVWSMGAKTCPRDLGSKQPPASFPSLPKVAPVSLSWSTNAKRVQRGARNSQGWERQEKSFVLDSVAVGWAVGIPPYNPQVRCGQWEVATWLTQLFLL